MAGPLGRHRAWLIDLDGTLYWPAPVRAAMAVELLLTGRQAIGVIRRFRHEHERLRLEAADTGNPYRQQLARTAAACGLPLERVEALVDDWLIARPLKWVSLFRRRGLIRLARRLKAAGGHLAVVSDYPARRKLAALGLADLVDVVVANGEVPGPARLKPCPDGYAMAAGLLNVPSQECLVIGDRHDADGEAAARAGMTFVHVSDLSRLKRRTPDQRR
jgi:putative hydrolase of the HAD superfamily